MDRKSAPLFVISGSGCGWISKDPGLSDPAAAAAEADSSDPKLVQLYV